MLECPGLFTMPLVPDGWTAISERNNTFFELQSSTRQAAVHISVYYRNQPARPAVGEAEEFLMRFVNRVPPEGPVRIVRVPPTEDDHRAFAKYSIRSDDGHLREWFAGCILWHEAMLICSCNAPPGHPELAEGETMIASIFYGTGDSA
jgi:hypothetical protein